MPHNAFYAQSGGVTAVINASAAGVIAECRAHSDAIGTLYAGRDGILGALTEELIDTHALTDPQLDALRYTPAGAFGSCRYKLKSLEQHRAQYERLIDVFRAHDIRYFFYNGGGDSQDTAHKVSQLSEAMGFPITCVGVPKTMDNDLPLTDCCPGFGSVAKYAAVSMLEASLDVASMQRTSTKVFVMEVMGRHAGWVAAATGLARDERGLGPDIILFPEVPLDEERFLAKVNETVTQRGFCMIAVSEGAKNAAGEFLSSTGNTDAFGHAQLGGAAPVVVDMIKRHSGYKCHWAVCDYLQRSARHIASQTDVDQAFALGRAAVRYAVHGDNAVMPIIVRDADEPYQWHIDKAPLREVANVERCLPADYITDDGFHITGQARRYLAPLIEGEAYPPYRQGLPAYEVLDKAIVAKRCPDFTEL
ncbi:6-phosphofructokinase [Marinimicrobium sp. ARAG 43.8]|uniref:6-phosphofructokinase n=1 Tax=Marinimicrobium sp. ARAG 43.8 TaxID=3418719 RepID=UPI003CFB83F1